MTFGERLKFIFEDASNADIARKMGVSEPAVNNYMNGRVPDEKKLLRIRTLTNCNLDWLLSGEGNPKLSGKDEALTKDDSISIRDLLGPLRLNDVEALWRHHRELTGRVMYFEDFFSELVVLGYESFTDPARQITEAIRTIMFDVLDAETNRDQPSEEDTAYIVGERPKRQNLIRFEKRKKDSPIIDLGMIDEFDVAASLEKYDDPQKIMGEWFALEGREYPADYGITFFQGWESFSFDEKIDAVNDAKKVLDRTLKTRKGAKTKR